MKMRPLHLGRLAGLLCLGLVVAGGLVLDAGEKKEPLKLPPVLEKPGAAETVDDLKAIEAHVQLLLERITPAVVGLRVGPGQGSGVIISKDGYVLTAGHVSGKPNQNATIILPNGKTLKGKTLGQNTGIDSGLIKITDEGEYPFLDMGKSSALKVGQWVVAIGHPGGFRPNRTPVVRVGRILMNHPLVLRTDCTLVGGDSGGPLFDMTGKVVGIHSRIGGQAITENMHVPVDTFQQTWDRLAKAESWGGPLGAQALVATPGGKIVFEKSGIFNDKSEVDPVREKCYRKVYDFKIKAGSTYTIDMVDPNAKPSKGKNPPKTGMDPYLRLETADKKVLGEDDDGGGGLNARIVYKSTKDMDVRIIATTCDPDQTGKYVLTVREADVKDVFVKGSTDVLKELKFPRPVISQVLAKLTEAGVPIHLSAVLVDDKGNPVGGKEAVFQWEGGKETLKANDQGVIRWKLAKEKATKLAFNVPQGLRAMVALTDSQGNLLPLNFNDPKQNAEKVKSAGGDIVYKAEGQLTTKDPKDSDKTTSFFKVHEFKMTGGKTYTIDLLSEEFDAFLRLEDNDGKKIAEDDDGAGNWNSRIVHNANGDGVYRLIVTTFDGGQTGSYRIVVRQTDTPAAVPGEDKKAEEKKSETKK
jgi:S1-C subfamily serine protease